jgi:hypothetical protein
MPKSGATCVNSKWPKIMLMSGATSAWLLYDMATATEALRPAVAVLQYGLLACALIGLVGLVGSIVMAASET